jgi:hypothetical protein
MSRLLVLLFVLLAVTVAVAGAPNTQAPSLYEPLPFDHAQHGRTFAKRDVTCVTCHPVGLHTGKGDSTQAPAGLQLPPPRSSCHGCHLGEMWKAPKNAPSTCGTCHDERSELLPGDHGVGWELEHGMAARARGASCDNCHAQQGCVACHDRRGPMVRDPHPPGWSSTHGVEARIDPASCTSCHQADSCSTCHASGVRPW